MTREQANQQGVHYGCGGKLQVAQRPVEGLKTMWIVGVRCVRCKRKEMVRSPYRRWFVGEVAMVDRRQRAIADFNAGAPWEDAGWAKQG